MRAPRQQNLSVQPAGGTTPAAPAGRASGPGGVGPEVWLSAWAWARVRGVRTVVLKEGSSARPSGSTWWVRRSSGAPTVALPNVTAVALGMYYTYTFHTYKPADAPFARYVAGATAVASLAVGTALVLEPEAAASTVGMIGCGVLPAMFAGPLAAARKVVSSKNAAAIPLAFTLFSVANTAVWIGYGLLVIHDVYIWGPNVIGLGAAFAQLALVARYGRK